MNISRRDMLKSMGISAGIFTSGCLDLQQIGLKQDNRETIDYELEFADSISNQELYELYENPSEISYLITKPGGDVFHREERTISYNNRIQNQQFNKVHPNNPTREVYSETDYVNDPSVGSLGCERCGREIYENWDKDLSLKQLGSKGFLSLAGLRDMREHVDGIFYNTYEQSCVNLTEIEVETNLIKQKQWVDNGTTTYHGIEANEYESLDNEKVYIHQRDNKQDVLLYANLENFELEMINIVRDDVTTHIEPEWNRDFDEFTHHVTGYNYNIANSELYLQMFPNPLPNCHIKYEDSETTAKMKNATLSTIEPIILTEDGIKQERYETETITEQKPFEYGATIEIIDPRNDETIEEIKLTEEDEQKDIGNWLDPEYEIIKEQDTITVKIYSVVHFDDFQVQIGNQTKSISTADGDYDGRGPYRPYELNFEKPSNDEYEIIYRNLEQDKQILLE